MWSSVSGVTITTRAIAQRSQRDESRLAVVEAAILECHGHARFDHRPGIGEVEAVLLEVARLLRGIEAVLDNSSVCIYMCNVKTLLARMPAWSDCPTFVALLRDALRRHELNASELKPNVTRSPVHLGR